MSNLIKHEGLHFWFGSRLLKEPLWFTEGFPEYYRDKIDYHFSGQRTEFLNNYNQALLLYFSSELTSLTHDLIDSSFFKFRVAQKLPYLRGYLTAGQIDSIIDLDSALKAMIKACKSDNSKCQFSFESLLRSSGVKPAHIKRHLKELIDNFGLKNLSNSFFNRKLRYKSVPVEKPELDITEAVRKGYINGEYLNKLDMNYQKDRRYKIEDIWYDCQNQLQIKLEAVKNQLLELPTKLETISLPYYE